MASKAAALRFLAEHVGETFLTVQVSLVRTWVPGPRKLERVTSTGGVFGESHFRLDKGTEVLELTDIYLEVSYGEGKTVRYTLHNDSEYVPTTCYADCSHGGSCSDPYGHPGKTHTSRDSRTGRVFCSWTEGDHEH